MDDSYHDAAHDWAKYGQYEDDMNDIEHEQQLAKRSVTANMVIRNKNDLELSEEMLLTLTQKRKFAEDQRKVIARKLDDAKVEATAPWKQIVEDYDLAIANIKGCISSYNQTMRVLERESAARVASDLANGRLPSQKDLQSFYSPSSGTTERSTWKFTIEDESALPREYLIPDESKIRTVVRSMKRDTNIPGVKVEEVKIVVVKSAKGEGNGSQE